MNRDWVEKDFYKVLGVSKTSSADEIKKAYRKLAQKYHPDANPGDKAAEERFKDISEANATLSNKEQREEYDQVRQMVDSGGFRGYGTPGGAGGAVVLVAAVSVSAWKISATCSGVRVAGSAICSDLVVGARAARNAAPTWPPNCTSPSKTLLPGRPLQSVSRVRPHAAPVEEAGPNQARPLRRVLSAAVRG